MASDILLKSIDLPNNETLGYRECGSGDNILLLIHGNMTSSKHWDLLLEKIPRKYKIYAIDLRGFGTSSYDTPIRSIKDLSEDIYLFATFLKLKSFTIMGWSMGSAVAMQYTIDHKDTVKKLVLMSGASIKGFPICKTNFLNLPFSNMIVNSHHEMERFLIHILSNFKNTNKFYLKALWDMIIYTENKPSNAKYEEYLDDMLTQRNIIDVNYALSIFNISHDFNGITNGTGNVDRITVPTLIIHGDKDKMIPVSAAIENKEAIGDNARIKVLKNCAHSPLIDKLDELIELLTLFLDE